MVPGRHFGFSTYYSKAGWFMRLCRHAAIVAVALAISSAAPAQQPRPEPKATSAQSLPNQGTIKAKVRMVLLDVVATDSKGQPVRGLRQEDFSVFEEEKPQQVTSFEFHTPASDSARRNAKPLDLPNLPPNTFLSYPTSLDRSPLTILLYDLLNTSLEDQPFARQEIVKFFRSKPFGSRFAIFALTDKLCLLQGFTDDERALLAAINGSSSQLSASGLFPPIGPRIPNTFSMLYKVEDDARSYPLARFRAERTIQAFADIARFVHGLPGRKNLIWLSGGFPTSILPDSGPINPFRSPASSGIGPFGNSTSYSAELRQAADLFTVGQIAVYPVDIRGLLVDPVFSAAWSPPPEFIQTQGASFTQSLLAFHSRVDYEHYGLDGIAVNSGGRAFYNTNALAQAIATAASDGANYYALSFYPTNTKFDGSLRRIRVAVKRKGCYLAYRRSYLADDDSVFEQKKANLPDSYLEAAMRRGAPAIHEIAFGAHLVPQRPPVAVTAAQIAQLSQFPAFASRRKWDEVQMQGYSIEYVVVSSNIAFVPLPDGVRHATLEFLFAAYDAEGNAMTAGRSGDEKALSPKDFSEVRKEGYRAQQVVEIPSNAAWLRLAVRDAASDRIGAMEISLPLTPEPQPGVDSAAKGSAPAPD